MTSGDEAVDLHRTTSRAIKAQHPHHGRLVRKRLAWTHAASYRAKSYGRELRTLRKKKKLTDF